MILQEEFRKNGYTDILKGDVASEYGINLEDIFDLDEMSFLHASLKLCSNPEDFVKNRHLEYVSSLKKKHSQ